MTTEPLDPPLSRLEQSFIDQFLREHGYDPLKLADAPDEERRRMLREASIYASGKLVEVEARSRFVHEIHDGARE